MPMQSRPFYPAGPNDRHYYGNNFCFLTQKHWKFNWASDGAQKALDTAGYSSAERKIIPVNFLLLPESQDEDSRAIAQAMIETYALYIQPYMPAYAAQYRAWLAAQKYGGYKPFNQTLESAAAEIEERKATVVNGADLPSDKPETVPDVAPWDKDMGPEDATQPSETPVEAEERMQRDLAQAGARALDTRPEHLVNGTDTTPAAAPAPRPRSRASKLKAKAAASVNKPRMESTGDRL